MSMQNHVGRRLEPDVASTRNWLEDLFESTFDWAATCRAGEAEKVVATEN